MPGFRRSMQSSTHSGDSSPAHPLSVASDNISKVLVVNLSMGYGGVDVRVFDMARLMHEADYVYAVAVINGSRVHQRLQQAGLPYHVIHGHKWSPGIFDQLVQVVQSHGYNVVESHNAQSWWWSGLLARRLPEIRLITTVHVVSSIIPGGIRGLVETWFIKRNGRYGSRYACVSEEIRNWLVHDLKICQNPQDVLMSYNAIDLDAYRAKGKAEDIRTLAGWPADTVVVGCVGRLRKHKGFDYLLHAMGQIRDSHPRIRCAIVGEGRQEKLLRALVRRYRLEDRVYFAGFRSDIPNFLASVDAFAMPSRAEGLPYALLEAIAFELPVLASRVAAIQELYTDRENILFAGIGDIQGIAEALAWLEKNPEARKRLGQKGLEFTRRRLTMAQMARETLDYYDSIGRVTRRANRI